MAVCYTALLWQQVTRTWSLFSKKKKALNLSDDTTSVSIILDSEQRQGKGWNEVNTECGLSIKRSGSTDQVEHRYWGMKGLLLPLAPAARLETEIPEAPREIGNTFVTN